MALCTFLLLTDMLQMHQYVVCIMLQRLYPIPTALTFKHSRPVIHQACHDLILIILRNPPCSSNYDSEDKMSTSFCLFVV